MAFTMRTARRSRAAWRMFLSLKLAGMSGQTALALMVCLLADLRAGTSPAHAQAPTIVTAPEIWVTPAEETALSVEIEWGSPLPVQAMLIVRGLPSEARLSEGRLFGPGVWVVPLNALGRLRLHAPQTASRNEISLALVTLGGTSLAEKKVTLFIALPSAKTGAAASAAAGAAALRRQMSEADRDFAQKLLERGRASMRTGNVSVARQFYQRAADRGMAEAAMALAESYDAHELQRMDIRGVEPDPAMARMWYEKARELGSHDAVARLRPQR
jgi:hypothetical protein